MRKTIDPSYKFGAVNYIHPDEIPAEEIRAFARELGTPPCIVRQATDTERKEFKIK